MKRVLVLALCVVGFILIAAPTAVEYSPLFINGKAAGQVLILNGQPYASVEGVAKAGGATLTLQPFFSRQGNRLLAVAATDTIKQKDAVAEKQAPAATNQPATGVPAAQAGMIKQGGATTVKLSPAPGQIFRVGKAGEISSKVFEHEGKAYFPLNDLLRALGSSQTFTGGVKPGEAVRLNFSTNPNAILIGL